LFPNGEDETVKEYIKKSITFVMFITFAMCFGLITIARDFAPLYFGCEFQKTGILIQLLAITMPFLSFANVIRTQYLIPKEKDNIYIISVFLGAVVNLLFNFFFIPRLEGVGACIGTIAAEFVVMFYQSFSVRKDLEIGLYLKKILPFFVKSIIMFIVIFSFNYIHINTLLKLVIQVVVGCLIYGLINIKYIFSIIKLKKILNITK
jgi:O-antigen/teichoic acid export membrane protein